MRLLRPLAAAAALAVFVGGAAPARAETLADLAKRLGELRKRVNVWTFLVQQDPDRDTVVLYDKQTEEDFKKKDTERITAKQLVDIIAKKDKPDKGVRTKAGQALEGAAAKALDPDLAPRKRKGVMSERAKFARDHLIDLLTKSDKKDGDLLTRMIVHSILLKWFSASGSNQTAISLYSADNEATWARAAAAWKDVLKDS